MSLSVDPVVSFTITLSPRAPTARGFGIAAIFGTSAVLPLYDRMRVYGGTDDVLVDFSATSPEYLAAQAFFGQSPAPTSVKIGRLFTSAQHAFLKGGAASAVYTDYTAVTDGGFDLTINGTNRTIADLDFSGAGSMAAIATLIQTALNAALSGTTCVWSTDHFLITSPSTGTGQTIGFAVAPTTGGPSADISALLKLTGATGAVAAQGIAAETITAGLAAAKIFDPDFYGMTLTSFAVTQDIKDAAAWAETNKVLYCFTNQDANAKLSGNTSDLGYFMKAQGYARTFYQFSTTNPYAVVSMLARAMVVDFSQPDSTITLKFKQEPGVTAEPLTPTEAAALAGKNYNYYVDRGGFNMLEEGVVANGRFIDEVHGLDWLQGTGQNAVFGGLATSPTKVPQTDEGVVQLVHALEPVLKQAVRNGLLAPGVWRGGNLGEIKRGDYLSKGFYTSAGAVADMLQADKDARKSPPISAIGIGAGAIHSVAVNFTFQR
jgi:hypothetical protein